MEYLKLKLEKAEKDFEYETKTINICKEIIEKAENKLYRSETDKYLFRDLIDVYNKKLKEIHHIEDISRVLDIIDHSNLNEMYCINTKQNEFDESWSIFFENAVDDSIFFENAFDTKTVFSKKMPITHSVEKDGIYFE